MSGNRTNTHLLDRSRQRARQLADRDADVRAAWPSDQVLARLRAAPSSLDALEDACRAYADRPCLHSAQPLTFAGLWRRIEALAAGLVGESIVGPGDRVGLWGFGSVDWVVADLACLYAGVVSVPLPDGGSPADLGAIIAEAGIQCVLCSRARAETLAAMRPSIPALTHVVVLETDDRVAPREGPAAGTLPHVWTMTEIEEAGRMSPAPSPVAGWRDPDRLRTLVYTSGSGGRPKGVMFPEHVWVEYWRDPARGGLPPLPGIRLASLPLGHIAGRRQLLYSLVTGGATHFMTASDMSTVLADARRVRPTVMMLVPRVSSLIHRHYLAERLHRPGREREILEQMRHTVLGDRLLLLITGSAPTAPDVGAFLTDCFDVPVLRGYATTEAGVLTFDERPTSNVLSFRLADVPALGYRTTDTPHPRGELRVKTRAMAPGYYRNTDASRDLFDELGYMRTGDIVEARGPEELVWIDRAQDVVKLAQGEFVEVSRLESLFAAGSPFIHQIYVHANSLRARLAAVVVPERAALDRVVRPGSDDDDVYHIVLDELRRIAEAAGLRPHELPVDCLIVAEPFSIAQGLLTESGKLARHRLRTAYGDQLDALTADAVTSGHDDSDRDAGIGERVREIIRPLLDPHWRTEDLPDDIPLGASGLGLDSMALVEIMLACDTRLGVTLDVRQLRLSPEVEPTLGRVIALVAAGRAARA